MSSHKCYFHKSQPITHFCTRPQCTLPMCQQCLPIHLQQHIGDPNDGVVTFVEAEQQAVRKLGEVVEAVGRGRGEAGRVVEQVRAAVLGMVEEWGRDLIGRVEEQCRKTGEVEARLGKIKKGSLKTLIYFYSEEEPKFESAAINEMLGAARHMESQLKQVIMNKGKKIEAVPNITNNQMVVQTKEQPIILKRQLFQNPKQKASTLELRTQLNRRSLTTASTTNLKLPGNSTPSYRDHFTVEEKNRKNTISQQGQYVDNPNYEYKFEDEVSRQKEISRIRAREEERQTERKRQKDKETVEELIRVRDRERMEIERMKEKRQALRTTEPAAAKTISTEKENRGYLMQLPPSSKNTYNVHEQARRSQESSWNGYKNREAEQYKPLQVADLNVQQRPATLIKATRSYTALSPYHQIAPAPSENMFEISKEVLSPEQIRRMLEKRIEERSRLLARNKAGTTTPPKYTGDYQSNANSYSIYKELEQVADSGLKWDTRDSIINQIYHDYKH